MIDYRVHISALDNLFASLFALTQNRIADGVKRTDGTKYSQIAVYASSELLYGLVCKGDHQNLSWVDASFFYKIAHFGCYRCGFAGSGSGNYQRMVFFRKHHFALFPVKRYGWIAGFKYVIEIGFLRFDMARNISIVVTSDRRRFRCKVSHFIEFRPEIANGFHIEIMFGNILV